MSDFNQPTLGTVYITVLDNLKARDVDAITLCLSDPSNKPVGTIRYNRANNVFEEWSGTAWVTIVIAIIGGGTGAITAAGIRTALALGSMALQDNNAVNITAGTLAGGGAGLTGLDAANIATGTILAARLVGTNYIFTTPELKAYAETLVPSAIAASAITLNLANGNHFGIISLNSNVTVTISGTPGANKVGAFTTIWKGDGTARTITWPASVVWATGTAPVPTPTVNKLDIYTFISYDNGVKWLGSVYAQNQ